MNFVTKLGKALAGEITVRTWRGSDGITGKKPYRAALPTARTLSGRKADGFLRHL
jgi:hypothetical protein